VQPGQTITLMHFVVQRTPGNTAGAKARIYPEPYPARPGGRVSPSDSTTPSLQLTLCILSLTRHRIMNKHV